MEKLNITKEQFNRSRYFQRKYGELEYVSESGKLFKTNKGKVLMFKEYTDGYEGIYGHPADGAWDADRQSAQAQQIKSGVILRRTSRTYDLWLIETVEGGLRLKENIYGFDKAQKIAKKNGWKVVKTIPRNPEDVKESTKKFVKESNGLEWLKSFKQAQDFVDKACEQLEVAAFEGGADVGNPIHKKLLRIWSEMRDVIESV